ncbi:uncharacterized protein LOC144552436 [Carex rostrata]
MNVGGSSLYLSPSEPLSNFLEKKFRTACVIDLWPTSTEEMWMNPNTSVELGRSEVRRFRLSMKVKKLSLVLEISMSQISWKSHLVFTVGRRVSFIHGRKEVNFVDGEESEFLRVRVSISGEERSER